MAKTIDFESSSALISIPPKISGNFDAFEEKLTDYSKNFDDSILIATSGTTAHSPKIVVLSKSGLRTACLTVNQFLDATSNDKWLLGIPHYHIGGLSILYRAFLSNSLVEVYNGKWSPFEFCAQLQQQSISFCSMVPTQLYDIVSNKILAPSSLKKILIGGGNLNSKIYNDAINLGWPIVYSFGMTESSAMFSYSLDGQNNFTPLPHVNIKISDDQRLMISGPSVLSGYITHENNSFKFTDPKLDGWYTTDDVVSLEDEKFTPKGRFNRVIKINGNLVYLDHIHNLISESLNNSTKSDCEFFITSISDIRSENTVILVTNNKEITLSKVLDILRDKIPKYALPSSIHFLDSLPKTDMGKIMESEIKKALAKNAI
jgi:O-succinylbenzoic acid--CoA ligase